MGFAGDGRGGQGQIAYTENPIAVAPVSGCNGGVGLRVFSHTETKTFVASIRLFIVPPMASMNSARGLASRR
jgi:hypothetical protein